MEIKGENLITKVLSTARKYNKNIPPLEITLEKFFPTGSGIGAGSGNAGAMIRWLRDFYGAELPEEDTAKLGADVAFLASDNIMATARGIGEIMTPLKADLDLGWLLVFPRWRSNTKEAYAKLDERRGASFGAERDADIKDIEAERERYLGKLSRKERAGLLPNDFFSVLADEHAEYTTAQGIAAETGSLGWGLCGSGSAFFGLYDDEKKRRLAAERFNREQWVLKTYDLE
ncbi:MAG: hypothetical protein Q4D58_04100 [Synergistaceae bacterium]|nr:hypothetical protein [Synergistaceae bacterium]